MNILKTLSRFVGISNSAKRALRAVADEQQAEDVLHRYSQDIHVSIH